MPDPDILGAEELRGAWVMLLRRHHLGGAATTVDIQEINASFDVLRAGARAQA